MKVTVEVKFTIEGGDASDEFENAKKHYEKAHPEKKDPSPEDVWRKWFCDQLQEEFYDNGGMAGEFSITSVKVEE